eukprot:5232479-Pleurochrysis_carterae.AAC.1
MPKHQLLLAVQARHKQLNQSLWAQLSQMRILPLFTWTSNFIAAALELEPDYVLLRANVQGGRLVERSRVR